MEVSVGRETHLRWHDAVCSVIWKASLDTSRHATKSANSSNMPLASLAAADATGSLLFVILLTYWLLF